MALCVSIMQVTLITVEDIFQKAKMDAQDESGLQT